MGDPVIQSVLPGLHIPRTPYTQATPVPDKTIIIQEAEPLKTHRRQSDIVQPLFSETDAPEKGLYVRHED
jgi:hypothetical protein